MSNNLIEDLITFISQEKDSSLFLTDEEAAFFQKTAPQPQIKPIPVTPAPLPTKLIPAVKPPPVLQKTFQSAPKTAAADIILLTYRQGPRQIAFLKHLTRALSICLGQALLEPAAPAEATDNWQVFFNARPCKLFIITKNDLQIMPRLQKHYRKEQKHFLNNTELFVLQDIASYLQNPLLKPELFQTLSTTFKELA